VVSVEDDESGVAQAQSIELVQDLPDGVVHERHRGEVPAEGRVVDK
jgi:hypothetical protein